MNFEWTPFGDGAWRARLPEGVDVRILIDALKAVPRVIDAVVTERHALVVFDPALIPDRLEETLARVLSGAVAVPSTREHVIPVRYDGPDLDEVARTTGTSREEVISLHEGGRYWVAAIGFLPGFAYLRGLDGRLAVPRRASPRTRVDALSVAIAGPYAGVYPFTAPGGWNIIGTAVGFEPFDPRFGAALALGDRVRFARAVP